MLEVLTFLFPPFVACIMVLGILGYLGIHVLKREIIFIDITIAQIAAMGAAVATVFFHADSHDGGLMHRLTALAFTTAAAAFFAYVAQRVQRISQETVIGVSYAIAAAATLFIFATAAGGDVHMEEMLTGNVLWADWPGIMRCFLVYVLVGVFHFLFRRKFIDLSERYTKIEKKTSGIVLWDFLFYASMGVVITFSVETAGVLLTFSFLIIPAAFSSLFARSWAARLMTAWGLGTVVTIAGLAFSYRFDFSLGPSLAAILGIVLVVTAAVKHLIPATAVTE
ncbi:MAG: metal ABC transporter permease [Candidatus Latescibacteria bacterium]|nr:metal ABC transporter permease [Candidatus Latescibacterota bacterium]